MNNDPIEIRMRELAWRQALTEAEKAELRAWLAAHPDAQADWEAEAHLTTLIQHLPDVPVASNFTARVLQAVEREQGVPAPATPSRSLAWLRVFALRLGAVGVVLAIGLFAWQQHQKNEIVQSLVTVSQAQPDPALLKDFEAIHRLSPAPAPDKDLLALMQ